MEKKYFGLGKSTCQNRWYFEWVFSLMITTIIFWGQVLLAQQNPRVAATKTFYTQIDSSDLVKLDSLFQNKRVIGIGESTHGTSEFTTMRHRIFKYLVEKHGFNTFCLEADYTACMRLNRYINGCNDDASEALREVELWPWLTTEMLELVEWMRTFNQSATVKLKFMGCDMQLLKDACREWPRFLIDTADQNKAKSLCALTENSINDTFALKKVEVQWMDFFSQLNTERYNENEKIDLLFMQQEFQQWFKHKFYKGAIYNFRDSCMSVNIAAYLDIVPVAKIFFFAHNFHVSKVKHTYEDYVSRKAAGRYLAEHFGAEYLAVGQTTNVGRFNAVTFVKGKPRFTSPVLKKAKKGTLEYQLARYNRSVLYCDFPNKNLNAQKYTGLGAIYGKSYDGIKMKSRFDYFNQTYFDAMIYIHTTTPSHLIIKRK